MNKKLVKVNPDLLKNVKNLYESQMEGLEMFDSQVVNCALAQVNGKEVEIIKNKNKIKIIIK